MNRKSFAIRRRARRRGSIFYLFAGALVMLLGFGALTVDYGVLVNDKNYLQRVCDAAALGGATKLTDANAALTTAKLVTTQNNFVDNSANDITYTFLENNTRIRVEAVRRRSLFFAKVLGQDVKAVRAYSIASIQGGSPDIVPIGITTTSYQTENPIVSGTQRLYDTQPSPTFTTTLVNRKRQTFQATNFMLFDMRDQPSKSPSKMEDQLAGRLAVNVTAGDVAGALDGDPLLATALNANSQAAKFLSGMTARFQAAAGSPWLDIDATQGSNYINYVGQHYDQVFNGSEPLGNGAPFTQNPRVMSFIVTPPLDVPVNGTYDAPIVALAPVYVIRTYVDNGDTKIEYRYLPLSNSAGGSGTLVE